MIRIEQLHKQFNGVPVLCGVDLDVRRGETAVIIGASGGGKSTLLRCINALESFDAGSIRVGDLAWGPAGLNGQERLLRRKVGMIFQQFHLFPHFSVLENVMAGPIHALALDRDVAADRARRLLDRVGLGDKIDERPATLSGGQQQRVAIARALANEPEAILFDEPTSALDPRMTAEVLSVMADLSASGQTMLVASHAMGFVRRSAHRVHVMADGQVIESAAPEQIFDSPADPRTRELLAHSDS